MTRYALVLIAFAACSKTNPYYCEDSSCAVDIDSGTDTVAACSGPQDCGGDSPVCAPSGACVACTAADNGSCGSMVCSATNECAPCTAHDQCGVSGACLMSTGACLDVSTVAYVATGGVDTGTCTKAAPCETLTYAAGQKSYVKLENNIVETVVLNDVSTTVLADPQTLISRKSGNDNAVVAITGTSNVVLTNVVITGGATANGHGLNATNTTVKLDGVVIHGNSGLGLTIGSGTLTMTRSLVSGNTVGGVDINSANFDITNSVFVHNGTTLSQIGGARLQPGAGTKVFSFNTVANNSSENGAISGINCTTSSVVVTNTIVSGNSGTAILQCSFQTSMFDTVAPTGTGNKTGTPDFQATSPSAPLAAGYYRIASTSDAIDSAAATNVTFDIDGDSRPQGGTPDIGADEYK